MKVHYDEGIANHIGPEPRAGYREVVGEVSVGERAGQPWGNSGCRRSSESGSQHGGVRKREHLDGPAWSKTLARTDALCAGTGSLTL